MKTLSPDTQPEAEQVLIDLTRQALPSRKLALLGQMNHTLYTLALSGLRQRHPQATPEELRRRMAELWLGDVPIEGVGGANPARNEILQRVCERKQRYMTPLTEPVLVTLLVTDALHAAGIPYFIGGSLASTVHGVVRATRDVDIIADVLPRHVPSLVQTLEPHFVIQEETLYEAIRHRSCFNAIHRETFFKVDVVVFQQHAYDRTQMQRRIPVTLAEPDRTAYVASAEDTILSKLAWYHKGNRVSDRQWNDVLGVLKVQATTLSFAYMRRWAADLHIADILEQAIGEAGLSEEE